MKTTDVLGVRFVNGDVLEAVEYAMRAMAEHSGKAVVAPDSEMLLAAGNQKLLMEAIEGAELILPAGSGIVCASHILGLPLKKKITAMEFASALMARMSEKRMSVFILAPEKELLDRAVKRTERRYPGLRVLGCVNTDYVTGQELADEIGEHGPDLLLVGLGTPKQEYWIRRYSGGLRAGLLLGFGAELKVLAGVETPVPQKWQDSGFEWLYKVIQDPRLIPRMVRRTGVVTAAVKRRLLG